MYKQLDFYIRSVLLNLASNFSIWFTEIGRYRLQFVIFSINPRYLRFHIADDNSVNTIILTEMKFLLF